MIDINRLEKDIEIAGINTAELESMEREHRLTLEHWDTSKQTLDILAQWQNTFNDLLKTGSNQFRNDRVYICYKAMKLIWNRFIKTDIGYITVRGY